MTYCNRFVAAAAKRTFSKATDTEMEAQLQVRLRNQNRFKEMPAAIGTVTVKSNDSDDGLVIDNSQ